MEEQIATIAAFTWTFQDLLDLNEDSKKRPQRNQPQPPSLDISPNAIEEAIQSGEPSELLKRWIIKLLKLLGRRFTLDEWEHQVLLFIRSDWINCTDGQDALSRNGKADLLHNQKERLGHFHLLAPQLKADILCQFIDAALQSVPKIRECIDLEDASSERHYTNGLQLAPLGAITSGKEQSIYYHIPQSARIYCWKQQKDSGKSIEFKLETNSIEQLTALAASIEQRQEPPPKQSEKELAQLLTSFVIPEVNRMERQKERELKKQQLIARQLANGFLATDNDNGSGSNGLIVTGKRQRRQVEYSQFFASPAAKQRDSNDSMASGQSGQKRRILPQSSRRSNRLAANNNNNVDTFSSSSSSSSSTSINDSNDHSAIHESDEEEKPNAKRTLVIDSSDDDDDSETQSETQNGQNETVQSMQTNMDGEEEKMDTRESVQSLVIEIINQI